MMSFPFHESVTIFSEGNYWSSASAKPMGSPCFYLAPNHRYSHLFLSLKSWLNAKVPSASFWVLKPLHTLHHCHWRISSAPPTITDQVQRHGSCEKNAILGSLNSMEIKKTLFIKNTLLLMNIHCMFEIRCKTLI